MNQRIDTAPHSLSVKSPEAATENGPGHGSGLGTKSEATIAELLAAILSTQDAMSDELRAIRLAIEDIQASTKPEHHAEAKPEVEPMELLARQLAMLAKETGAQWALYKKSDDQSAARSYLKRLSTTLSGLYSDNHAAMPQPVVDVLSAFIREVESTAGQQVMNPSQLFGYGETACGHFNDLVRQVRIFSLLPASENAE